MESCQRELLSFLQRNAPRLAGCSVLAAGEMPSAGILEVLADCPHSAAVCDDLRVYARLLAALGQEGGVADGQIAACAAAGQLTVLFAEVQAAAAMLGGQRFECLLVLLGKSRAHSQRLVQLLAPCLAPGGRILLAGHNSLGARSAASLLSCAPQAQVRKADSARKCTLHEVTQLGACAAAAEPPALDCEVAGQRCRLRQLPGVFSCGRADAGTLLLLQAAAPLLGGLPRSARILDLGCGCGIISMVLAAMGFARVEASDISATALALTQANARLNGCEQVLTLHAAELLRGLGRYDLIISNPPSHALRTRSREQLLALRDGLDDHLRPGGRLVVVANTFLQFGQDLAGAGWEVQELARARGYSVLEAARRPA